MKPVFREVATLDRKCYDRYKLTEDVLMEHAAYTMALEIYKRFPKGSKVTVVAGPGNNGGDGIALGRILLGDYEVELILPLGAKSEMARLQLERFKAVGGEVKGWQKGEKIAGDVVVDALFGSGLKRDLKGELVCVVKAMNRGEGFKLACDIPTGLDEEGNLRPIAFEADLTVTMGAEKIALYSDFAKDYVGEVVVADLGVSFKKYRGATNYYRLEVADFTPPVRTRQNTHKRSYGHLGVVVGEKPGAGIMAGLAAFNFGTGLVTCVTDRELPLPFELMSSRKLGGFTAITVGMGLGDRVALYMGELMEEMERGTPILVDADLFYHKEVVQFLNGRVVLTPHPKEFAALIEQLGWGKLSPSEVQLKRFELVERFTEIYPEVVLVLKGANRLIAYKGKIYIDPLGDVALAKGGSGDVMAGLIGGLLAQGYHPLKAAITGSLALSLAGKYSPNFGLTPSKLIKRVGELQVGVTDGE
jgi:hydroxyethylthiazole kinase-like uncharacterized protein yjeF